MSRGAGREALWLCTALVVAGQPGSPLAEVPAFPGAPADKFLPLPLPLRVGREISFDTSEGTWISLDVAPDGGTLVFDLLGDLYTLDMRGGRAIPLLTGLAFEGQPSYSPDGSKIAFISDRGGSFAPWFIDRDGRHPRQVAAGTEQYYAGPIWSTPAWAPDGRSLFVTQSRIWSTRIWRYPVDGGAGAPVAGSGDEGEPASDPVASPDGRFVYYNVRQATKGPWDATWDLRRTELASGREDIVVRSARGAMRPALSRDGRLLAYGSRIEGRMGLRLRNLETGDDRVLAYPVQSALQASGDSPITPIGLLPRYAFTPDGKEIVIACGGTIRRIDVATGHVTPIPFEAAVRLDIGPSLRRHQRDPVGPVRARIIQTPQQSPDGRQLVFSALGQLYLMSLAHDGARPMHLPTGGIRAYEPVWSPDGRWLAFVSWTDTQGGHIWKLRAKGGGVPRQLTRQTAFYKSPVFSPDGREIIAIRYGAADRIRGETGENTILPLSQEIVAVPSGGGDPRYLTSFQPPGSESGVSSDPGNLHFGADGTLYFYSGDRVHAIRLDGSQRREVVRVTGPGWIGEPDTAALDLRVSPDGKWILAHLFDGELYVAPLPENGRFLDLAIPDERLRRVTSSGADYSDWIDGGRAVAWSVGSTFHRAAIGGAAEHFEAIVEVPRDVPHGSLVLRGATVATMKGDEVIADADVVIANNRIAAIGARGRVEVPPRAQIRDVSGRYITPGFVDTHYHSYYIRRGSLDLKPWEFAMQLAYGVTASLDPSGGTVDSFVYEDLAESGQVLGGRGYTVGPAVGNLAMYETPEEVSELLRRYRDDYRTLNIKAYLVGDRNHRQILVNAASELGLMPTTEGAYDMAVDLTHAIDGFYGNEHALPVTPLYRDVIQLYARSAIAYTPTLAASALKKRALGEFLRTKNAYEDLKVRRFMPQAILETKAVSLPWQHDRYLAQGYPELARGAAQIWRAGGRVGIGSHGNFPGLGYHAELKALASGGLSPHEVLQIATRGSSEVIARETELGTLESGKYADLLVFTANPLAHIDNSLSLALVMKNGRLYDAGTLDEVWPRLRPGPLTQDRPSAP